jgi:hypothetical protein
MPHGSNPSRKERKAKIILLNLSGCEARKASAVGEVFFLGFYLL